ncbi:MAG TPA: UDP-4-amino-4,6-dideoxy-N-acetyl-beta-L-altrosamine transaminase [Longimicrobiales bacterium]|nr:UDP-4-amino-4,6-dideoxy-N-acetyl-beta-L-altrosamine transaminase [Longimicrobiales bacterium]
MIPYGRHAVTKADIAAVNEVLSSDFLTQGPVVPRFEAALRERVGAGHAVAVSSGTAALHVACAGLGLGTGDLLWTSPITFVASANCGLYCGADVDFVDIDPLTFQISAEALHAKLKAARKAGRLPRILVTVHLAGHPSDQDAIWDIAREFGVLVVEDACHALGAQRHGVQVGSCTWSHATVFSFHPVKLITTAEGGAVLTNDPELAWRMGALRTHGITRDPHRMANPAPGPCDYEQVALGWNYRMSDLHAALGLSQLARLDALVDRRNELAARYGELLAGLPLRLHAVPAGCRSAWHLYIVVLEPAAAGAQRRVIERLPARGIGVSLHYPPVHLQPYFRARGFGPGAFTEAERYGSSALTLPLYPAMTEADQDRVVEELARAMASVGGHSRG